MVPNFMIEIDKDLDDAVFYNSGGVGNIYISKCGHKVFKVTFNISAFVNNIKWFTILNNIVPCSQLLNFNIKSSLSDKFIKSHIDTIKSLFKKNFPSAPDFKLDTTCYVLLYKAYDCNAFGFLLNAPKSIVDRTLPFLVIWTVACIYSMRKNGFYHNDFKLDNILLRRKFVPTIVKVGDFIFENKTDFDYFINDFDMTIESDVFCDIQAFTSSLKRMISQRGDLSDILNYTLLRSIYKDSIENLPSKQKTEKLFYLLTKEVSEFSKKHMCIRLF